MEDYNKGMHVLLRDHFTSQHNARQWLSYFCLSTSGIGGSNPIYNFVIGHFFFNIFKENVGIKKKRSGMAHGRSWNLDKLKFCWMRKRFGISVPPYTEVIHGDCCCLCVEERERESANDNDFWRDRAAFDSKNSIDSFSTTLSLFFYLTHIVNVSHWITYVRVPKIPPYHILVR